MKNASDILCKTMHQLQIISPDAPNIVMGDFNHCKMEKSLSHFDQYVDCLTRCGKHLDLCYGSIKGAYKSSLKAPLGLSDHHVIYLAPVYKPLLKRVKKKKIVPVWSEDSIQELMGCFECTDWELFRSVCTDLDDLTETVTNYIVFC